MSAGPPNSLAAQGLHTASVVAVPSVGCAAFRVALFVEAAAEHGMEDGSSAYI